MKCQYCGKEVWLVRHLLDGDFCSPAHRRKYNERLRRALDQLPSSDAPPAPLAGFHCVLPPADAQTQASQRSCGFQSSLPWPLLPQSSVGLAPSFGQAFFPCASIPLPAQARTARHTTAHAAPMLRAAPRLGTLSVPWAVAGLAAPAPAVLFLPPGAPACRAGVPARALGGAPAPLALRLSWICLPQLALRPAESADSGAASAGTTESGPALRANRPEIGRVAPPAALRTALQLPGWAWQPLEAGTNARPYSDLATRHAAFGSGIGCGIHLRPVPCVLPVSVAPLFATALAARGGAVPAGTLPAAQALARAMRLPGLPRAARPTPAHESDAIWNIRPASPWSQPPAAAASALALPAAETRLPRMTARPARPALPAQWRVRSIATAPVASAAAAVACADTAAPPSAAPALAAMMLEAEVAVALPAAGQPRPPSTDLAPRERPALPCAAAGPIPRPSAGSAGQSLALPIPEGLGPLSGFRHEADPLDTQIPAAAPRAAAWRAQGPLAGAAAVAAAVALPVSESAGFTARGFAALPPRQATLASRHLVPAAMPVSAAPYAFRQSAVSIPGIELPALAGSVPLDVYVQRVRSAARRDCEWRPVTAPPVHQPAALPDLWPVRFEQQVLQDWRRRQPRKSAESNPAAAKVQVMPRRAGALARLGARTSQVVKGLAAAAAITAILWIGAASKQTHGPIGARGQWLRNTIAQRATVVFDDDFRSGLNLWEGRKNWAQSWSHSPDGFVRTGQLALYRPSMKMTDYRLEFFAQIENKSVGWVARARDEQNYYAMKLAVTAPGPRPLVSIVRYPVTAGKKGKRVQVPLPIMFHNNTPYRVAVDVKGNRFRAFIEGQEIDSWQDDRLRAGGVGFFSENGEHARLYWVKVSNHTDWLGRLCGMIAGQEQGQAWERGNPAAPAGSLAAADSAAVLDAGKIADKKRGAGMLPFTAALLAGAR